MEAGYEDVFDSLDDMPGAYSGAGLTFTRGDGRAAFAASSPRGEGGEAFSSDDIELALQEAEMLVCAGDQPVQEQQEQAQLYGTLRSGHIANGIAGTSLRPPSAISLGEAAINLRLTLHEKELELLELRAQCAQLAVSG